MGSLLSFLTVVCVALSLALAVWGSFRLGTGGAPGWRSRILTSVQATRPGSTWRKRLAGDCVRSGRSPSIGDRLLLLQLALAFGGTLVGTVGWGVGGLAVGWSAAAFPWLWLQSEVRKRQKGIRLQLPAALDLMGMTIESGLDFGTALARTVERLRPGGLREELESALRELRLGKTRGEALLSLRERVAMQEVGNLVTAVVQAERMGTPLGPVLRGQVAELRVARTLRAETLAAEAPVRMLLPLVVCIFPTVFLILLGPIAFSIFHGSAGG